MDELELRNMLYSTQFDLKGPIAIRYPRGRGSKQDWKQAFSRIETGKGRLLKEGKDLAILSVGPIGETMKNIYAKEAYRDIAHYDLRFVKPLDKNLLDEIFATFDKLITIEDGVVKGGFGEAVVAYKNESDTGNVKIKCLGLPDRFVPHGSVDELYAEVGLDQKSIEDVIDCFKNDKIC